MEMCWDPWTSALASMTISFKVPPRIQMRGGFYHNGGPTMENNERKGQLAEEIREFCKRLRLSKAFADRTISYDGELEGIEYVHMLLAKEVALRKARSIEKCTEAAGLPCHFDPGEFDTGNVTFPPGMTMERLLELPFCEGETKGNVLLYGGPGVGKTMLSSILGRVATARGYTTVYYSTHDLVDALLAARDKGNLRTFLKGFEKVRLLILDDFGYIPCDVEGTRLLFRFMSMFFRKKPIILCTNVGLPKWQEMLQEERLAACIAGRVMENGVLIKLGGVDRRISSHRAGN